MGRNVGRALGMLGCVLALAAEAQAQKTPSIAPPEDVSGKVVRLPGGYMRYQPDPDETGEPGGLIVMERSPVRAQPPQEPEAPPIERPGASLKLPRPPCEQELGLVAQRLLELRGLDQVGPKEALTLLALSDGALGPHLQWSMFGLPALLSGWSHEPLLVNAYSFDMFMRERVQRLAACLSR